jgi:single-stranded DNA-binding protein
MYNRITLVGTIVDDPQEKYDPDANRAVCIALKVPPPPDAPPTHWGLVFDMHSGSDWPTGDDTFLVICRNNLLGERCLQSLQEGDLVCVEGRLVLTLLNSDGTQVPLAEILASEVILLSRNASPSSS